MAEVKISLPSAQCSQPKILIVKMEGVQPLDENVGNAPGRRLLRNKLLLVASVIQGLGLLLCLTYICLHLYAQVPSQYPPIQSIKVQFTKCENDNGFIITPSSKDGTMKVQNNSIIINCDGFYLISLKGYFLRSSASCFSTGRVGNLSSP